MKYAIPTSSTAVPARIARQTLAKREDIYAREVRALLDAALEVMRRCGTTSRPRVADIVAAAGLSNDAFYRHFSSKDALVSAILIDGAERLAAYLEHHMAKEPRAAAKVRKWVEGVLSQAEPSVAGTTLAVLWNGDGVSGGQKSGRSFATDPLALLLEQPFRELGSADPQLHAALAAHATLGQLSDYLWRREQPAPSEVRRIIEFCLAAVSDTRANDSEAHDMEGGL